MLTSVDKIQFQHSNVSSKFQFKSMLAWSEDSKLQVGLKMFYCQRPKHEEDLF